jgi:hypothetical protein
MVTLTTDFGLKGPYVGAMKGALFSANPSVNIADITHSIEPQNVLNAAVILAEACPHFPAGTVHVAVVDPGVGGKRRPIAIETENYVFVGPDNGIFTLTLGREKIKRAVHLTERKYFAGKVSSTFHGRDVFAPVAGRLSLGLDPALLGKEVKRIAELDMPKPRRERGEIIGRVLYADSFGNLITDIPASCIKPSVAARAVVCVKGTVIAGLSRTYSDAKPGALIALSSSSGFVEIAVNGSSAKAKLGAGPCEPVVVRFG